MHKIRPVIAKMKKHPCRAFITVLLALLIVSLLQIAIVVIIFENVTSHIFQQTSASHRTAGVTCLTDQMFEPKPEGALKQIIGELI